MFVLPEGIEPSPYHRKWHVLTSSLWQHLQIFSFILNPFESFLRMVCDQNVYLDYIQLGVIGATLFLFIHTVLASLLWDIVSGLVWYRLDSNQWHPDFQSGALPTELRYLVSFWLCKGMNYFFNIQIFYKVFFIFFFLYISKNVFLWWERVSNPYLWFFRPAHRPPLLSHQFIAKKSLTFYGQTFYQFIVNFYLNLWHELTFRWSNPPRQQKMRNQIC